MARSAGLLVAVVATSVNAAQIDIPGPAGSGSFGASVTVLPNGNVVVTDPSASVPMANAGAVHLFSPAGVLISTLTGSSADDQVGSGGVTVVGNGNYVILSPFWNNGGVADVGAVSFADGDTGLSGVVSPVNSLIGSTLDDRVGSLGTVVISSGVTPLINGNYVVRSPNWNNGAAADAGAVTWGDGSTGTLGVVSASNSLIGTMTGERVGFVGVTALSNGNFVVRTRNWSNGGTTPSAGAVTWVNGGTGRSGAVSPANSLVGSTANDLVGSDPNGNDGVIALSGGNFVVISSSWDHGAVVDVGAVTWVNGGTGLTGAVSPANSLIGSTMDDRVGRVYGNVVTSSSGITALSNGNFVVLSPFWNNGAVSDVGAATWVDGDTGLAGAVSPSNSLIGSTLDDRVGSFGASAISNGVAALANGNYVVHSPNWDNGATADVGAATWADGSTGLSGLVSPANSLIGTTASDQVGVRVVALSNGNYVVTSSPWDNGAVANVGAVTWGNGSTGLSGTVSPGNSLIGTTTGDGVGSVTALSNGNFVVGSVAWNNGATVDAGAATWADGSVATSGVVSAANSLVGTTTGDQVGGGVTALGNGNYLVASGLWNNVAVADAGAVTWGNGSTGTSGVISAANSLVGSRIFDFQILDIIVLNNGNFLVLTPMLNNGVVADAGAVTWGHGGTGISGAISASTSLIGTTIDEHVGSSSRIAVLGNGNYVVSNPDWGNGGNANAGAVAWADASMGISGTFSVANSLVGTAANDRVGSGGVTAVGNGGYVVSSPMYASFGAVTLARDTGLIGTIVPANSVRGTAGGGGASMVFDYDTAREQLVVGRPASDIVSILTLPPDQLFANGFE